MTQAEVDAHNLRVCPANKIPVPADAVTDESELHADIRAECRRRGWMCFGGDMSHRTRRVAGEPDFVIAAYGRVYFVECKTRVGKLCAVQVAVAAALSRLGHTVHIVRSMSDFIALTK